MKHPGKLADAPSARTSMCGRLRLIRKTSGFPKTSPAKLARMRRSLKDSFDPIRYILVTPLVGNRVLHYRVEDDTYGSHITLATRFKRFRTGEAVRRSIGSVLLRQKIQIVRVKKAKSGVRLVKKIKFPR